MLHGDSLLRIYRFYTRRVLGCRGTPNTVELRLRFTKGKSCIVGGRPVKQRAWHVANVWCKMKRSKGVVAALVLLLAVLQNSVARVLVMSFRPSALDCSGQRIHMTT